MIDINWTYLNETVNNTATIEYINRTIIIPLIDESRNWQTLTIITFIGLIISLGLFYLIWRKFKANKENSKIIVEKTAEIELMINKLKEGRKINQIDIRDLPKPIKENILETKGFWGKIFSKIFIQTDQEGHIPPFMLLIRSDMTAEIRHNVKEGEFILEGNDEKKTKKRIILSRSKLIDLKLPGGKWRKIWVQYEDEAESYPIEPRHLSKAFYYIVEAIQMNKNLMQGKGFKFPKILIIIGIIIIIGALAYFFLVKGDGNTVNMINETINQTIQQNTTMQYNVVRI